MENQSFEKLLRTGSALSIELSPHTYISFAACKSGPELVAVGNRLNVCRASRHNLFIFRQL
jgi:hypothetical protein